MVRSIILALIAFVLIALGAIWILSGGPRKLFVGAKDSLTNALPSNEAGFKLPFQPTQIFPTIDLANALHVGEPEAVLSPQEQLIQLEAEYDSLSEQARDIQSFGTPSPYRGKIAIMPDISGVRAGEMRDEYVQLAANYGNSAPIDISGWVLESALSGTRIMIPPAASPYISNTINTLVPITLEPGSLALVASYASPIGVSFRENMCSGYLGQFQSYSPPLAEECPSPSTVLPLTEATLQRYGDSCFDALTHLPSCRFPQDTDSLSGSCRAFLTEFLSYNGCVQQNKFRSTFQRNTWRVFLGAQTELWRNTHDAIRLLDAQGRTVSVFVY